MRATMPTFSTAAEIPRPELASAARTPCFWNRCLTLCRHELGMQLQVFLIAVEVRCSALELSSFARIELGLTSDNAFYQ